MTSKDRKETLEAIGYSVVGVVGGIFIFAVTYMWGVYLALNPPGW